MDCSLYRSDPVSLFNIFLQKDVAFEMVAELGELGAVSFCDLNEGQNSFQRPYTNELMRCDTIETQLRFFQNELTKHEIPIIHVARDEIPSPKYRQLYQLEMLVENIHKELGNLGRNLTDIRNSYVQLTEQYALLRKLNQFIPKNDLLAFEFEDDETGVSNRETGRDMQLNSLTGLIRADRLLSFERMLLRMFGHNIFVKVIHLEEPMEGVNEKDEFVYKNVFVIFFKGENFRGKLKKVCDAFAAHVFDVSDDPDVRLRQIAALKKQTDDLKMVISKSKDYISKVLRNCAKEITKWQTQIIKFRAIFTTMNKFNYDLVHKCLMAQLWCPNTYRGTLNEIMDSIDKNNEYQSPTVIEDITHKSHLPRPTYYRLNKFTKAFQNIVDSYGVANYQEMNPTPFTIISFPFLFAVMFGDAGHGMLMALFGAWMVLRERQLEASKIKDEIASMFFGGRYVILLMGTFSIYTGLMYNDVFSKSLNVFGSSFSAPTPTGIYPVYNSTIEINPLKNYTGHPYPFGMDPVWQLSENKILFLNSYKMKLSVILGVSQMMFGVILGLFNHLYFRRTENIFCEFIPQMIFLISIFGYMNVLIFAKWFSYNKSNSGDAPSILIDLINMVLFKYPTTGPTYLKTWYAGQKPFQMFLVATALICVPWILLPKVFYLRYKHRRGYVSFENAEGGNEIQSDSVSNGGPETNHNQQEAHHSEEFDFGDTFIHQAIHTIEYCLGSVSHTASYLRLWALSLAHAELSEVLWNMVLRPGLTFSFGNHYLNGVAASLCFLIWAFLSVSVLVVMEGLSAFLHALRLHWVEFQSKFYSGAGFHLETLDFNCLLQEAEL